MARRSVKMLAALAIAALALGACGGDDDKADGVDDAIKEAVENGNLDSVPENVDNVGGDPADLPDPCELVTTRTRPVCSASMPRKKTTPRRSISAPPASTATWAARSPARCRTCSKCACSTASSSTAPRRSTTSRPIDGSRRQGVRARRRGRARRRRGAVRPRRPDRVDQLLDGEHRCRRRRQGRGVGPPGRSRMARSRSKRRPRL